MKQLKSLRFRLIFWYVGSLTVFAFYFYIFVHYLSVQHATHIFLVIFALFAALGSFIIYRITSSITRLTKKMRQITTKNLDERVTEITTEDEIGELATTFNSLLDRLHDAFKREQQFIADVAHEIKTPLSTLRSSFEVTLHKKRPVAEYEKVLTDAVQDTNRISNTLRNILDLAWSEAPNEENISVTCNISDLMIEVVDIAKTLATQKDITIKESIEKEIVIHGHKDKLARAILNIVENAIKYTTKGGKVMLKLVGEEKKVIISVEDNGPGIEKEDIPHIFDRFYRGSQKKKELGSGIGLAISKSMITSHQGHIQVKSIVGKGTSFFIILPRS